MKHRIFVSRDKRGLGHPEAYRLIKKAAKNALEAQGIAVPCEIFVLLTDDEGIHGINYEQRGIDMATDVLSFPQNEMEPGTFCPEECEMDYDTGAVMLGDMVLSLERCAAQGEEYGHGFERELSYLTVHSVLHLLGYDHMDEGEEKRRMRSREDAVMELIGL